MLKIGHIAPAFTLKNQHNEDIALKDFVGRYVVLYFYPKDMTPGCTTEARAFQKHLSAIHKAGAEVIGISKDPPERHDKFACKYGLEFPLLSDPDGEVIERYGAWKEKSMWGKTFMGIARVTYLIGPDGKIVKAYPKVTPEEHAEEILAALTLTPAAENT